MKTKSFGNVDYVCDEIDLATFTSLDPSISIISMKVPEHILTVPMLKQNDLKSIWFHFLRNGKILVRRNSIDSEFSAKEVIMADVP